MLFDTWKDEVAYLRGQGESPSKISSIIRSKYFPEEEYKKVYWKVKRVLYKTKDPIENTHKDIVQNVTPAVVDTLWDGATHIRFGVVSDTHLNNKCAQITYLHEFYDLAERAGITDIYHCGDIDDGEQMRVGHSYECYTQGGDAHVSHICNVYPYRPGMTTHFITGNHDASIWKKCGMDIGNRIAEKRSDLDYLGPDVAVVNLTPNCKMELRHPWDGTSYAISYKPQKLIESLSDEEKPDILCIGHYHKQGNFLFRRVNTLLAASFCSQTPFMKAKGLASIVGGWLVDVVVDSDGFMKSITPQFICYEKSIVDDYKHYI